MVFKATVRGTAILFLGLLVIYFCKMFLDSGGWDKVMMAVFALSAILEICFIAWETRHAKSHRSPPLLVD
jgi:hypothetical protein